jgi:hypothetical protein
MQEEEGKEIETLGCGYTVGEIYICHDRAALMQRIENKTYEKRDNCCCETDL